MTTEKAILADARRTESSITIELTYIRSSNVSGTSRAVQPTSP